MASAALRRAVMCRPTHFKVLYQINPWMDTKTPVDNGKANQQWMALKQALENANVKVDVVEQNKDLPDMVFACNCGIVLKNQVYLSRYRHPPRQPEREEYEKWFKQNGFQVFKDDKFYFEGGGDAKFSSPKKLWGAYGFRSDAGVYDLIKEIGDFEIVKCQLVDSRFYQLDTCFLPLDENNALWYPQAFSAESRKRMEKEINLIAVDEADAVKFVCNSIVVGNTVIMPTGCGQNMEKMLERKGFKVVECAMSEFLKGGGACQCLVLRLDYTE